MFKNENDYLQSLKTYVRVSEDGSTLRDFFIGTKYRFLYFLFFYLHYL